MANAAAVAAEFGWTPAGASSLLGRYFRAGLLLRQRAEGGRAYEYALSGRGVAWLRWAAAVGDD